MLFQVLKNYFAHTKFIHLFFELKMSSLVTLSRKFPLKPANLISLQRNPFPIYNTITFDISHLLHLAFAFQYPLENEHPAPEEFSAVTS